MMGFGGFGEGSDGTWRRHVPFDSFRYGVIWFPNVPVQGQATQFQMVGQDLSFTHPLWTDPLNALSLSGGVRNRLIQTDAILPDTGQPIPADLWNVNLGLRYAGNWTTAGWRAAASASDRQATIPSPPSTR